MRMREQALCRPITPPRVMGELVERNPGDYGESRSREVRELCPRATTAGPGRSYGRQVPTPFAFEHVFRVPSVSALVDAYFDTDHSVTQDKVAQLADRAVVESHETDALRKVTWRVTSTRQLPAIARPFVKGGRLSFVETMTWNRMTNAVEMSVVPEILGGRVQVTGTYDLSQIGDGQVRRLYKGTITAALPLVGGKVERGILESFTENMPAMSACTQGWLDRTK